jgi:hypothetical protein
MSEPHDHGVAEMNGSSTTRAGLIAAVAALAAAAVAGCTSAPATGSAPAATQSKGTSTFAPSASGGASGASSSPGASPAAGSSGSNSSPSQKSMLDVVKHKSCNTSTFIQEAGLAGGALRAYVAKPAASGVLMAGAAGPIAQARSAVGFSGAKLQNARDALKGCPTTTNHLRSVLGQNVALLGTFRKELAAGKVSTYRSDAAMAMFADVVSQADHLRLKVTEVVPPAAELGR